MVDGGVQLFAGRAEQAAHQASQVAPALLTGFCALVLKYIDERDCLLLDTRARLPKFVAQDRVIEHHVVEDAHAGVEKVEFRLEFGSSHQLLCCFTDDVAAVLATHHSSQLVVLTQL